MSDHLIRSAATMIGSMLGYYIAKDRERESFPAMMLGGFVSGCIGEIIISKRRSTR